MSAITKEMVDAALECFADYTGPYGDGRFVDLPHVQKDMGSAIEAALSSAPAVKRPTPCPQAAYDICVWPRCDCTPKLLGDTETCRRVTDSHIKEFLDKGPEYIVDNHTIFEEVLVFDLRDARKEIAFYMTLNAQLNKKLAQLRNTCDALATGEACALTVLEAANARATHPAPSEWRDAMAAAAKLVEEWTNKEADWRFGTVAAAIRSLSPPSTSASPWRDIASVPKDERHLWLAYDGGLGKACIAQGGWIKNREVWMIVGGHVVQPFAWQPFYKPEAPALPTPPATEGWTGNKCPRCDGNGLAADKDGEERQCPACGGTGDEYGPLPATEGEAGR